MNKGKTLFILFLFVSLVFFIRDYSFNAKGNAAFISAMSIVKRKTFNIDPYVIIQDVAYVKGHYYSGIPPGNTILSIPSFLLSEIVLKIIPNNIKIKIYRLIDKQTEFLKKSGKRFGVYFKVKPSSELRFKLILTNIFFVITIHIPLTIILFLIFLKISGNNYMLSLLFILSTNIFYSSTGFITQGLSAFLIFISFYLLFYPKNKRDYFLAGVLNGIAISCEYPSVIYSFILYLFILKNKNKTIHFILGTFTIIIPLLIYHNLIFGAPWFTPYHFRVEATKHWVEKGIIGLKFDNFKEIIPAIISPNYGILLHNPIIFLIIFNIKNLYKERYFIHILIITLTSYILCVLTGEINYGGGYSIPRFFLPAIPFIYLLLVKCERNFMFYLIILISFLINISLVMFSGIEFEPTVFKFLLIFKYGFLNYTMVNLMDYIKIPVFIRIFLNLITITILIFPFIFYKIYLQEFENAK